MQYDINNPIDTPHLFIKNAKVDEFNQRVHNAALGNKYRIKAQDSVIGANSAELREMEYLLTNRFFMPLAEFMFGIFFLCICVTLKTKLA